jgi:hypothetical protein
VKSKDETELLLELHIKPSFCVVEFVHSVIIKTGLIRVIPATSLGRRIRFTGVSPSLKRHGTFGFLNS